MAVPDFMVCIDGVEVETFQAPRLAIERALDKKRAHPDALVSIVLVGSLAEGEKAQGVIQVGLGT